MNASFDPYYQWLAIPPGEQPPNHYRLLGVVLYESNPEVISQAADRQMTFVQTHKSGPHSADSQRLLNELSVARLCLLNPAKRAAYEAELKSRLAAVSPPVVPAIAVRPAVPVDPFGGLPSPASSSPVMSSRLPALPAPGATASPRSPSLITKWMLLGAATGVVLGLAAASLVTRPGGRGVATANAPTEPTTAAPAPSVATHTPSPPPAPVTTPTPDVSPTPSVAPTPVAMPAPAAQPAPVTTPIAAARPTPTTPPPAPAVETSGLPAPLAFDPLLGASSESGPREPAPAGADLAAAEEQVRDIIAAAPGVAAPATAEPFARDKELAKRLFEQATRDESNPARRYALMRASWQAATSGRDAWYACMVIDEAAKRFVLDPLPLKEEVLATVGPTALAPEHKAFFAEAWRKLSERAEAAGEYPSAKKYAEQALAAAESLGQPDVVTRVKKNLAGSTAKGDRYAAESAAKAALVADPHDALAAETWGRFLCFTINDFARGLPWLARSEGAMALPATLEIDGPADPAARAAVGDAWWQAAAAESDPLKSKAVQGRAIAWYRLALPDADDAAKQRIDARLADYETANPPFPLNEWVDLLRYVDLKSSAVRGKWEKQGDGYVSKKPAWDSLPVPVVAKGSYELEVKFARDEGHEDCVSISFPVGESNLTMVFSDGKGKSHRLTGPASLPGAEETKPGTLMNVLALTAEISVAIRDDKAIVNVQLEGRRVARWSGPLASLPKFTPDRDHPAALRFVLAEAPAGVYSMRMRVKNGRVRLGLD